MKAFVRVGLSQDHVFAKTLMSSFSKEKDSDITLQDFFKLFRIDELCDRIIVQIQKEVEMMRKNNFARRLHTKTKKRQKQNSSQEAVFSNASELSHEQDEIYYN